MRVVSAQQRAAFRARFKGMGSDTRYVPVDAGGVVARPEVAEPGGHLRRLGRVHRGHPLQHLLVLPVLDLLPAPRRDPRPDLTRRDRTEATCGKNRIWFRRTDVTRPAEIEESFTCLGQNLGLPAVLVNVAGIFTALRPLLDSDHATWSAEMNVSGRGF